MNKFKKISYNYYISKNIISSIRFLIKTSDNNYTDQIYNIIHVSADFV